MTTFSFVQLTDHHLRERESDLAFGFSPAYAFRAAVRHIAQHAAGVDFMVTTGDLVNNGTDAEYQAARAMLGIRETSHAPGPQRVSIEGLREMPMYFLPGNHDPREAFFRNMFPVHVAPPGSVGASGQPVPSRPAVNFGRQADTHPLAVDSTAAADASRLTSNVPTQADASRPPSNAATRAEASPLLMNTAFMHKGIRFICLDWGAENKAVAYPAMLEFLAQNLKERTPSIILMHHALAPVGIPRLDAMLPDDLTRFSELIRSSSALAVLCGHFHATYETVIAGIPVYGLRSTTFSFAPDGDKVLCVLRPPHYRIVTVSDGKVHTEIVEVAI